MLDIRREEIEARLSVEHTTDERIQLQAELQTVVKAIRDMTRIYSKKADEWQTVIDRYPLELDTGMNVE